MKVYSPNTKQDGIGGGFSFWRNFKKGMAEKVHFVNRWEDCDIFFITSVTTTVKEELYAAHQAGKKIVLRVDNVPRKSRNRRSSPHERLAEFAKMAEVIIYQSDWAKDYCYPLCGDGTVIYNGVDESIFKTDHSIRKANRYLFAYHGKNETKNFWEAWLRFQYIHRNDPDSEFWFIYDFGKDDQELTLSNFDFWNGEKVRRLPKAESAEEMAEIMQQCGALIYPSIADASPNIVLEARACGLDIVYPAPKKLSGTEELMDPSLDISLERMCEEYFGVFQIVMESYV